MYIVPTRITHFVFNLFFHTNPLLAHVELLFYSLYSQFLSLFFIHTPLQFSKQKSVFLPLEIIKIIHNRPARCISFIHENYKNIQIETLRKRNIPSVR